MITFIAILIFLLPFVYIPYKICKGVMFGDSSGQMTRGQIYKRSSSKSYSRSYKRKYNPESGSYEAIIE